MLKPNSRNFAKNVQYTLELKSYMKNYLVWVSNSKFKSTKPLTYSFDGNLSAGTIVKVPLRSNSAIGLIESSITKPDFKTKQIEEILFDDGLPANSIKLFKWLNDYYPASSSAQLQLFLPSTLIEVKKIIINEGDLLTQENVNLPPLTNEQSNVIQQISQSKTNNVLLHGETGSGKTRIYIEFIKKTISQDKSSLILTPEIGMTPQLLKSLENTFPGKIIVMHSSLTSKNKRENWVKILKSNSPIIVVGPRSALFSPIKNLGLIVLDEAHDSSFKQEQAPYYQASRVAAKLAEINNALLILGTATPLISDYYVFKAKGLLIARMTKSATENNFGEAKVETIKITDRNNFTKSAWLSDQLILSIGESLNKKEQSIVYLNRRGTARVIVCQSCSWQALCPICDTNLTYHADKHSMMCHGCSYTKDIPSDCPICSSPNIIFKGVGTKAIVEELSKLFHTTKISRFDKDNNKEDSLEQNYDDLLSGVIDIAVGTQIITKGLDLPKLSTIGVIVADSSLYFPDFSSEERTFQNIMQVIGRVGRGHTSGNVIIQTYNPDGIAVKAAIKKDFESFYNLQIQEREKYKFPPFVFLLKISCKRASQESSQKALNKLMSEIKKLGISIQINGPAPSFYEKQNDKFEWQIIIKSKERKHLLKIISTLPANFIYDIDPISLL